MTAATKRDSIKIEIEEVFATDSAPTVVLVPSTPETLANTTRWSQTWPDLLVVAPIHVEALTPQQLLERVRSNVTPPARILIFSDQLVSALHANVPLEQAGRIEYVSGLEAVLNARYAYRIAVWTPEGFEVQNPCETVEVAMGMLIRYFAHCRSLGERWIMRDQQTSRSLRERVVQARRELRFLESAVLYSCRANPIDECTQDVLARIGEAQKCLIEARRVYDGV